MLAKRQFTIVWSSVAILCRVLTLLSRYPHTLRQTIATSFHTRPSKNPPVTMNVQRSVIYPIKPERHGILSVKQVASKGRNGERNS
jgi:hypothetical protein